MRIQAAFRLAPAVWRRMNALPESTFPREIIARVPGKFGKL